MIQIMTQISVNSHMKIVGPNDPLEIGHCSIGTSFSISKITLTNQNDVMTC